MEKSKVVKVTLAVLLAAPVLYLGIQMAAVLNRPYRTETAIAYDMSDSIFLDGYLAFAQTPVEGSGTIGYLVEDGERVSTGNQVGEIYTNGTQAKSRQQLTELNARIALLKKSQNTSSSEVSIVQKQMKNALYDLMEVLDDGNYQMFSDEANDYLLAANQMQIITGQVENFSSAIAQLEQDKQQIEAQIGQPAAIVAPTGGYFLSSQSGDYLAYTQQDLFDMTAQELQQAIEEGAGVSPMTGAGKIITSYAWRFFAICTEQESHKFKVGSQIQISFPGYAEKKLPAQVESVELDEETGIAKIVLECEYINTQVLSLTIAQAQIDFESYKGVRINANALHIVDGQKGVYVKYGNLIRWRTISILYQNDDYILVPEDGKVGTENEVRMSDEIIVEGVNLKDGLLIR